MTEDQVETIVAYLASAYRVELSRGTILVWKDIIESVDYEVARTAAKRVVTSDAQFMPAPGVFLNVCHQIGLHYAPAQRAIPDGTGEPVSKDQAKKNLRQLKALIDAHPIKKA